MPAAEPENPQSAFAENAIRKTGMGMRIAISKLCGGAAAMACLLAAPVARGGDHVLQQVSAPGLCGDGLFAISRVVDFARLDLAQDRRMFFVRSRAAREDFLLPRRE
jgi:hypothetical protein